MNDLCADIGYRSINHAGEQLCGDRVEIVDKENENILVLADGLGSGVKANILSTLTSKIISTMLAGGMPIEECIDTIASTLPVCKVRQVAYSTFTVIRILENRVAELIQFDNPAVIVLRNGTRYNYPVSTREVGGKQIHESRFEVMENDVLIAMSDGAPFAGVGKEFNYGWQRDNIIDFAEANYHPDNSAKYIAANIVDECNRLYEGEPGDDTTVAVVRVRARQSVNLVIGPPSDPKNDIKMMNLFFAKQGEKIICGGTTASIASQYLGSPITTELHYQSSGLPPIAHMEGVDLVTEGIITISRVIEYAKDVLDQNERHEEWGYGHDGACLISRMLF